MTRHAPAQRQSSPARGSRHLRTYRVTFSVTDYYVRDCRALSAFNALRNAQRAYSELYEQAFELDISRGGSNGDWEVEEVAS